VDTIKTRMQALSHPGQRLLGSSLGEALQARWRPARPATAIRRRCLRAMGAAGSCRAAPRAPLRPAIARRPPPARWPPAAAARRRRRF